MEEDDQNPNTLRNFSSTKIRFKKNSSKRSKDTGGGSRLFGKNPNIKFDMAIILSTFFSTIPVMLSGLKTHTDTAGNWTHCPPSWQYARDYLFLFVLTTQNKNYTFCIWICGIAGSAQFAPKELEIKKNIKKEELLWPILARKTQTCFFFISLLNFHYIFSLLPQ